MVSKLIASFFIKPFVFQIKIKLLKIDENLVFIFSICFSIFKLFEYQKEIITSFSLNSFEIKDNSFFSFFKK